MDTKGEYKKCHEKLKKVDMVDDKVAWGHYLHIESILT